MGHISQFRIRVTKSSEKVGLVADTNTNEYAKVIKYPRTTFYIVKLGVTGVYIIVSDVCS